MHRCVPMLALILLTLPGCEAGYSQFYRPTNGLTPESVTASRAAPPPKTPTLDHASAAGGDLVDAYLRHGYVLVGYSSFNSGRRQSENDAIEQAKKVQADIVVIVDPHYTGSRTTSVPITTPTTSTTYTNGTATAIGPGGTATAYGNATSTTYGTQTNYVPFTVHRFDYGALYFVKRKPMVLGVYMRDLNDSERAALQSNKGVFVLLVVDGSPAFNADILRGDIIVSMDGEPALSQAAFHDALFIKRNKTVQLSIVRNGQTILKEAKLNDSSP
jgi:PDZ domain